MDRMNVFAHYQSKSEYFEDVLTRAFLLVLRLVPSAHRVFLELLARRRSSEAPPLPDLRCISTDQVLIQTQTGALPSPGKRLLSVLLTDSDLEEVVTVKPSRRTAVYDGVIAYGPDWIFMIENKPHHKGVWHGQLSPDIRDVKNIDEVEETAVVVPWQDLVRGTGELLIGPELDATSGAVLRDFLAFVDEHFPFLKPYHRLSICGGSKELLDKRCRMIMEEIVGPKRVAEHRSWAWYMNFEHAAAQQVALAAWSSDAGAQIVLILCPGDTVRQARLLYAGLDADGLLALVGHGWTIRPNFHLSDRRNLCYPAVKAPLSKYLTIWKQNQEMIAQYPIDRDESSKTSFRSWIDLWIKLQFAVPEDVGDIERVTVKTKRSAINVCPGIVLQFAWPLSQAIEMDQAGAFTSAVRERLSQAFATWGQEL
ncbi:MAG: hypothetical protein FJ290_05375 [Planctomycetes bacterium]|nr:hypothetical protein [Planctomycetota bacterium]